MLLRPVLTALLLCSVSGTGIVHAQSGTLIGTTSDALTHEPLAGVRMTARKVDGGAATTVVTDSSGNYRIADLAPGTYSVQWDKPGYLDFVRPDVQVRPNRTLRINAVLLSAAPSDESPRADRRADEGSGSSPPPAGAARRCAAH